jgi:diadenosine tetraphosphate (Ap4A) HIT family hydrolase
MTGFTLDPRITAVSIGVTGLWLSELRLINDARFPWLILVPRVHGAEEVVDLTKADRAALCEEITAVSQALLSTTGCDKLNIGALGNLVRQLHIHVVARFAADAAWPGPVWGNGTSVAYEAEERDRLITNILTALPS